MTLVLTMLYVIGDTRYLYLPCYTWPRYMTPVLIMLHLTYGTWHRYLPCYIRPMILETSTCHAISDTWHRIPLFDMLCLPHDIQHWYLPLLICHHLPCLYFRSVSYMLSFNTCISPDI